ncbi:MAG: hypothetical protein ACHP8A_00915 [Terriglobales bacterium]|jgi:hypothetical protein|nr:hypothetical protein [Terriglobales bacterium]
MAARINSKDQGSAKEPRWLALIAMLASGLVYAALPSSLSVGPRWLLLVVIIAIVVSVVISHRVGHHTADRIIGYAASGILTLALIWSLGLLVAAIPKHDIDPKVLLRSAVALWVTNILVFALWYWRLDAGGPHEREKEQGHKEGAFLFPQMNLAETSDPDWSPNFVDYLFLAFNTSTALSPADTQALSRWAKILMMIQATISLTVLALLAARAVNIL